MTSGLRRQEIAPPNPLYRTRDHPPGAGKPFWPAALVERIRAVVHAVAPIGYEDESGFYFGEQPARRKTEAMEEVDSSL
jgi:hypothetical protein